MCTLALAWQVFDEAPVAAAANRDERYDRPSEPPERFRTDPVVIAPRDRDADGTWIGVNEHGVFVAITNRWASDLAGERSRGLLVADALACESAAAAGTLVSERTAEEEYDGFYLVTADEASSTLYAWDGSLDSRPFSPGVHVVVNVGADGSYEQSPEHPKASRRQASTAEAVRERLAVESGERHNEWLDRAGAVLANHELGTCRHENGFGTRSSSLIATGPEPTFRFADGPPCRKPYQTIDLEGHI